MAAEEGCEGEAEGVERGFVRWVGDACDFFAFLPVFESVVIHTYYTLLISYRVLYIFSIELTCIILWTFKDSRLPIGIEDFYQRARSIGAALPPFWRIITGAASSQVKDFETR